MKLNYMDEASKFELQKMITKNTNAKAAFIAWVSTSSVCCIFHHKSRTTDFHLLFSSGNGSFDVFKKVDNVPEKKKINAMSWNATFYFCRAQLSCQKSTRQSILWRQKSNSQKKVAAEKRKSNYANMEPALTKQHLFLKAKQYRSADYVKRENNLSRMCTNSKAWYN